MKRNLDTGVEVCDNRAKKNQRHTTNKKPNMYKDINKDNQYLGLANRPSSGSKYWLSLYISLYIFGFSFVVWRWFFFTLLSHTSTPVSRFRFIDLDPAAVLVPVAFFFYMLNYQGFSCELKQIHGVTN